ncbi:MAG: septum formation initiator family protein [Eubacterium sp.]|nr:septum formation initiator family protein [Eubacterium sp.]
MVRAPRRKSKSGLIVVLLVVLVVIAVSSVKAMSLHEKSEELAVTERQLEAQIESAKEKAEELENREKYMQTKRYVEDEAKNKLGLVYPDEIVIRPSEQK